MVLGLNFKSSNLNNRAWGDKVKLYTPVLIVKIKEFRVRTGLTIIKISDRTKFKIPGVRNRE